MLTFKEEELREKLRRETGSAAVAPARFFAFSNVDANVLEQVHKIKSHPWIPRQIPVRGFVYDVKTGKLREVKA
jgi:carbonic anhydrase